MAEIQFSLVVSILLLCFFDNAQAYVRCGDSLCSGTSAYCCGNQCCYYVWGLWWFWMLWIGIFMLLTACSLCCRRRYRRYHQPEYVIVRQAQPGYYGTLSYGAVEGPVPHGYNVAVANAPAKAPEYVQKPPEYSPS